MPKFRKKPIEIEAFRYEWGPGVLSELACWIKGEPSRALSDGEITDVLQPTALWDPPANADLELYDAVAHKEWLPLANGDWVIKGVNGEFYPCKPDIFRATYDPVEEG